MRRRAIAYSVWWSWQEYCAVTRDGVADGIGRNGDVAPSPPPVSIFPAGESLAEGAGSSGRGVASSASRCRQAKCRDYSEAQGHTQADDFVYFSFHNFSQVIFFQSAFKYSTRSWLS
jgi:hypothetical protein